MGIEALGFGSTLGILLPIGLLLAFLFRRERPVRDMGLRISIGFGLLGISCAFYGFTRFGIAGLLFLLPIAITGLERWPRSTDWAIGVHALFGAFLVLGGPVSPFSVWRTGAEAYRERFDAAWSLTHVANSLPPEARIASAGVLRPQGWGARLEFACEDYPPALARAIGEDDVAAALRRRGFTHLVLDDRELARLRLQYGHLAWNEVKERKFLELLNRSRLIAVARHPAALFELPVD
jgi:hypothetical protein